MKAILILLLLAVFSFTSAIADNSMAFPAEDYIQVGSGWRVSDNAFALGYTLTYYDSTDRRFSVDVLYATPKTMRGNHGSDVSGEIFNDMASKFKRDMIVGSTLQKVSEDRYKIIFANGATAYMVGENNSPWHTTWTVIKWVVGIIAVYFFLNTAASYCGPR